MSRFNLVLDLDENARFALVLSLAQRIGSGQVSVASGEYVEYLNLMRRLLEAPKLPEQATEPRPVNGTPAAASTARVAGAPVSPTAPEREKLSELVITPTKIDQPPDGKSMVVHYRIRTGNAVRSTKMHCWDAM